MDIWGEQTLSGKFMSWSLKRPSNSIFSQYKKLAPGEPWYSKNYITVDENAPSKWNSGTSGFLRMVEQNHEKIHAMGMHEFMICDDGTIASMGHGTVTYPNGYVYYDQTQKVLNVDETSIIRPVQSSLLYLMHQYPNIRWSVQILATANSSGDRVKPLMENMANQDNCIRQTRKIVELYQAAGFPIVDVEVDLEKTNYEDANAYKLFLERVKNEVCIPTNTQLRVNLFAMTGDFTPSYYGWHDYATIASATDQFGKQAVDEFQLMTYDFSWGGSAPGPSTPLWWLKQVLDHVKKVLPPEKTLIGNAGYGRRWPLSDRRMGVTFDYKQLMLAQNGMYVHNDGKSIAPDPENPEYTEFWFNDQDFIPVAGFNDPLSDYQITYLNVYDMFKSAHGNADSDIVRPEGKDYVTNYSTAQRPKFTGIKATLAEPSTVSGNSSQTGSKANNGVTHKYYVNNRARWVWDSGLQACIKEPGNTGEDGNLIYNFSLSTPGTYRVIALVGFPFYGNDKFDVTVNGVVHKVGENIPDWYPYITNPSTHFWDCGTYNLVENNTISVGVTDGAQIGGFIICDSYDQNITGGNITFSSNLQKMKKRGNKLSNGKSEIIDAKYPAEMTLTGEILRRAPRAAIIWEDMFGPHLREDPVNPENSFTETTDITGYPFYQRAKADAYTNGSGPNKLVDGTKIYCIDKKASTGFSQGVWNVRAAKNGVAAHIRCDTTDPAKANSAQLVLNKKMNCNASIEADIQLEKNTNPRVGLRLLAQEIGEVGDSYLFVLDWSDNKVKILHEVDGSSSTEIASAPMSAALISSKMSRLVLKAQIIEDKLTCQVGDKVYFNKITLPYPKVDGAYGVYMTSTILKVYRLTIATLDRFEPMEKILIHVEDGQSYEYGKVERTVPYDEFGYLVYTGYAGNLTEAVRAIPSESESSTSDPSQVVGRAGTIFETEVVPEEWSLDYRNLPLVKIPLPPGKKNVTIEMKDPGIWLRTFYIGDSQGFSVAYNSDKVGFIRTSQMVLDYGCKGIAMWTLGQEDPQVFEYIDKATN